MRRLAYILALACGLASAAAPLAHADARQRGDELTFARVGAVGGAKDCVCIVPADVLWTARVRPHRQVRPLRACAGRLRRCRTSSHAWSPDGRRLAFPVAIPHKPDAIRIRLVPERRGILRDDPSLSPLLSLSDPTWSPDGRRLAVTASRASADSGGETRIVTAIYVVDVRSGRMRQLTDGPTDAAPDWSTKGEIAFQRAGPTDDPGDVDLFAIRSNGSGLRRLTSDGGLDPDWSPDGRRLAFARVVGIGEDVFTMTAAGGDLRRITDSGWATAPAWSPDGRLLAYEDGGAIRVGGVRGGPVRTIARPGAEHSFAEPAWRPQVRRR